MDYTFILSCSVLFFLLMDPFGNLPLFVAITGQFPEKRYSRIVLRESVMALIAMCLWMIGGKWLLLVLDLSSGEIHLAGGLILLLIGIKMVFAKFAGTDAFVSDSEPFFFPLAVPLICGPGLMAMLATVRGSSPHATLSNLLPALLLSWLAGTLILLGGRQLARLLGHRVLNALEALMGLLLTAIAVGMLVHGLHELYGIGPA